MELWDESGVDGDEELESMLGCLLDFPMESLEGDGVVADWESQQLGPIPMDVPISMIDVGPPVFMHTPPPLNKSAEVQETGTFQSQSPVSVLENSGSSLLLNSHVAKRTRSKRARPSGLGPWLVISPPFSASDAKRTKGRRNRLPRRTEDSRVTPHAKKCTHCEITKTPQWREGPLGPKTLCNACGVRFRSGRLFPEYRPAASPTFVPSLHSNSHKKVIEMRNKDKLQVEFIPASGGYLF